MNDELCEFARNNLRDRLPLLPERARRTFKLMYGRLGGERSVEDAVAMSIDDVIAEIPPDKLSWAMKQAANTVLDARPLLDEPTGSKE